MTAVKFFVHIFLWVLLLVTQIQATPQTVRACEWHSVTISCPAGEILDILYANYGRTANGICNSNGNTSCSAPTSYKVIQNECQNQPSCTVWANYTMYGADPCYGTLKYVEVLYNCMPATQLVARACDGSYADLTCPAGHVLHIIYANYGRTQAGVCSNYANGDLNCSAPNSSNVIKSQCENEPNCRVSTTTIYGPDPCYGTLKYVEVIYQCLLGYRSAETCEGGSVLLTCPAGKVIHITTAIYGRTENGTCGNGDTNCRASNSLSVMQNRCENQQQCTVPALSTVFGDPCAGTFKYLRVRYDCRTAQLCETNQFRCNDGKCIGNSFRCNGHNNCPSGEDEINCGYNSSGCFKYCASNQFRCKDGTCISKGSVCNGIQDCSSGEDESNCIIPCTVGQVRCKGGKRINSSDVCNGILDCCLGEDEDNCVTTS